MFVCHIIFHLSENSLRLYTPSALLPDYLFGSKPFPDCLKVFTELLQVHIPVINHCQWQWEHGSASWLLLHPGKGYQRFGHRRPYQRFQYFPWVYPSYRWGHWHQCQSGFLCDDHISGQEHLSTDLRVESCFSDGHIWMWHYHI